MIKSKETSKIILRGYQQKTFDSLLKKLEVKNKIAVVLPTGGGKSVLIAKIAHDLPGKSLILTHRIEILQQNSKWLGDECSVITSKKADFKYDSKITVAMVQTAYARIEKYGVDYLGDFDNIILDEVQILIFEKVFKQYNFKKLIGFTATPVLTKTKTTIIDGVEFVEPYTLNEIFEDLVSEVTVEELIDLGYLVQDFNISLRLPNFDSLKESSKEPDGYTKKSLNEVYANTVSLDILSDAYDKYCVGKKTIIFNATTKVNVFVYNFFKDRGLNVKMFDSVNKSEINEKTGKPYKRKEIIEWFKNERDAILVNTNVFTTGFDVDDVECVIVNRATKSLSLWIQMVGRGSRITDKIFKDKFTVIDLGQNIYEHGRWSKPRDWSKYFFKQKKRRKNIVDLLDTWECSYCGYLNIKGNTKCDNCGREKTNIKREKKKLKKGELEVVEKMPLPTSKKIIEYCMRNNKDSIFALNLMERKLIELFYSYDVKKDFYFENRDRFVKRIKQIGTPIYFGIIKSKLGGQNRTYKTMFNRIIKKIDNIYGYE